VRGPRAREAPTARGSDIWPESCAAERLGTYGFMKLGFPLFPTRRICSRVADGAAVLQTLSTAALPGAWMQDEHQEDHRLLVDPATSAT